MATFAYGRVSTKEQSTENQRLEIVAAGYAVDYWFADEGVRQSHGPAAAAIRQAANPDPGWRDLVVAKLDRLGRDAHDVGGTIKHLATRSMNQ